MTRGRQDGRHDSVLTFRRRGGSRSPVQESLNELLQIVVGVGEDWEVSGPKWSHPMLPDLLQVTIAAGCKVEQWLYDGVKRKGKVRRRGDVANDCEPHETVSCCGNEGERVRVRGPEPRW